MGVYLNNVSLVRQLGTYIGSATGREDCEPDLTERPAVPEGKILVAVLSHPTRAEERAAVVTAKREYTRVYNAHTRAVWLYMNLYTLDRDKQALCN
jgi:hypothetical protein